MDKRPRSGSKGDHDKKPLKKKQKKNKSGKSKKGDGSSSTKNKSGPEATATVEGQTMAQVLSTFDRLEQSRFEAFRRSVFPADAISNYISHSLAVSHERATSQHKQQYTQIGKRLLACANSGVTAGSKQHPQLRPLRDMVAPDQAEEITAVVSTLAKAYAQRLVTSARRVAAYSEESEALTVQHVLQAHRSRTKVGLDPGFFLQAPVEPFSTVENESIVAAALGRVNRVELKRNAALAAEEAYDKYMREKKEASKEKEDKKEG